ncbi:MAG: chemotaxis protein CheW [Coleofasciculaceae cyanobacterium]
MLMLTFSLGEERYAISARQVVEVISLVKLQKISQAPTYIAGSLNYRGDIIPIIDLCELITKSQYSHKFSTRIIVVNYGSDQQIPYLLGLIAEKVTETLNIKETDFTSSKIPVNSPFYLGEIINDQQGMIHCLQVESLLSKSQLKSLLPK